MSVFIVYESFWNPGPIHCARLCSALTRKLAFDKFLNLIFFVFCFCDCLILRHYLSLRLGRLYVFSSVFYLRHSSVVYLIRSANVLRVLSLSAAWGHGYHN